ncbi:PriCT-2 domain-containing protein [Halocynthiibacter sp. C4]|uniref:PriCT-2 domain-containing protein n=1 Tax=Halocynthiibacter sp. C4 TaxID=2992758 RepID=UPI00237A2D34|nr:PriCT-2 domain-containing protein [Halocynthiibacter sp. C4]
MPRISKAKNPLNQKSLISLKEHGLPVIPLLGKQPKYKNWVDPSVEPPSKAWKSSTGVGLLLGHDYVCLDLDTPSGGITSHLLEFLKTDTVFSSHKQTLVRFGHPDKAALLIRIKDEGELKKLTTDRFLDPDTGFPNQLELLVLGQQAVMFGHYPAIKDKLYDWYKLEDLDTNVGYDTVVKRLTSGDFPEMTTDEIVGLFNRLDVELRRLAAERAYEKEASNALPKSLDVRSNRIYTEEIATPKVIKEALKNISPSMKWQIWAPVIYGLHHWYCSIGKEAEGYELAQKWSSGGFTKGKQTPRNWSQSAFDELWRSADPKKRGGYGIGTVFKFAGVQPKEYVDFDVEFAGCEVVEDCTIPPSWFVEGEKQGRIAVRKMLRNIKRSFNSRFPQLCALHSNEPIDYWKKFINEKNVALLILNTFATANDAYNLVGKNRDPFTSFSKMDFQTAVIDNLKISIYKHASETEDNRSFHEFVDAQQVNPDTTTANLKKAKSLMWEIIQQNLRINRKARVITPKASIWGLSHLSRMRGATAVFDPKSSNLSVHFQHRVRTVRTEGNPNPDIEAEYLEHAPFLPALTRMLVASNFKKTKEANVLLLAPSNWGKSELLGVFRDLGLLRETTVKETAAIIDNKPVAINFVEAAEALGWWFDELRGVPDFFKSTEGTVRANLKNGASVEIEINARIASAATMPRGLQTEAGADPQLINRWALIRMKGDAKTDLPLLNSNGVTASEYRNALKHLIIRLVLESVDELKMLGLEGAQNAAEEIIHQFRLEHPLQPEDIEIDEDGVSASKSFVDNAAEIGKEFIFWIEQRAESIKGKGIFNSLNQTEQKFVQDIFIAADRDGTTKEDELGGSLMAINSAKSWFEKFLADTYPDASGMLLKRWAEIAESLNFEPLISEGHINRYRVLHRGKEERAGFLPQRRMLMISGIRFPDLEIILTGLNSPLKKSGLDI